NSRDLTSNFYITLKKQWNQNWNTQLRLGNDIFERKYDMISVSGSNFVIPRFYNINNTTQVFGAMDKSIRRLVGIYGDFMVDYKIFPFLNITGRNDISSTLSQSIIAFFYPSVNLCYVFIENLDLPRLIALGKIRASVALVGKDTSPPLL